MAGVFVLSNFSEITRQRIGRELKPKKTEYVGTQTLMMYVVLPKHNRLYVPYYYAKCLAYSTEESFDSVVNLEAVRTIVINDRPEEQTAPAITFGWKLQPQQIEPFNRVDQTLVSHGSVFLHAATASGKSAALSYIASKFNVYCLVYVTNKTFADQITKSLRKATNAVVWQPSGTKGQTSPPLDVRIVVVTPKQYHRVPEAYRDSVGLLMIDEAHLTCTRQSINVILDLRPRYVVAMTATAERNDGMEIFIRYLCGPAIVEIPFTIPVRYLRWDTGFTIPKFTNEITGKGDWTKHVDYIANHNERNEHVAQLCADIISLNDLSTPVDDTSPLIQRLLRKFSIKVGTKFKIILLTANAKDQNDAMLSRLRAKGLTCDYRDGGKGDYIDCQVLVGHPSKNGTGFDQQTTCTNYDGIPINIVIPMITSKSPGLCMQCLGRAARAPEAIKIDLRDKGVYTESHYKKGMAYVLDDLIDLEVIDYDLYTKPKTPLVSSTTTSYDVRDINVTRIVDKIVETHLSMTITRTKASTI